jgi:hypothetical protein
MRVLSVLATVVLAIASTANATAETSGKTPALRADLPKRNLVDYSQLKRQQQGSAPTSRRPCRSEDLCRGRD